MTNNSLDDGINVLSLFDGMSCGQLALEKAGIKVNKYFASEINKYSIMVSQKNYPNTSQLGDITKVFAKDLPKIDLIIGGSPCQGFSFAGKGLNFKDPRSRLFFEFVRLIDECNPKYFLLENVKMKKEHELVISKFLKVAPIAINSDLLSAQCGERLYWTNINQKTYGLFNDTFTDIPQPKDKGLLLKDILEEIVNEKYYLSDKMINYLNKRKANFNSGKINYKFHKDKASCINANSGHLDISDNIIVIFNNKNKLSCNLSDNDYRLRKLTPIECERLQTVPDGYTDCVSNTQRYKMLGNGWTVDVVAYIFSFLA